MDLSTLSNNLPLTRSISKETIDDVNCQLNKEFKNAAKSVTNLYNHITPANNLGEKKSSQSSKETQKKNEDSKEDFTQAAKSVASLYRLSNHSNYLNHHYGYLTCLNDMIKVLEEEGDLENWILMKQNELLNKSDTKDVERDSEGSDPETIKDHEFKMNKNLVSPYNFKLSYPPLSVTHNQRQRSNWKGRKPKKVKVEEEQPEEIEEKKRKIHGGVGSRKKVKRPE